MRSYFAALIFRGPVVPWPKAESTPSHAEFLVGNDAKNPAISRLLRSWITGTRGPLGYVLGLHEWLRILSNSAIITIDHQPSLYCGYPKRLLKANWKKISWKRKIHLMTATLLH
jgi:hypothetical protein